MKLSFHANFDGRFAEALQFYQKHLGGVIDSQLAYRDSPMASEVPIQWQEKIIHGSISLDNFDLAGTDLIPEQYEKPRGFCLLIRVCSEQKVRTLFDIFKKNGTVVMPPQKTFWSPCYAIVTDRFGIPWKFNCVS